MHRRMSEPTKSRLKRTSFVHEARRLERRDPDLLCTTTKPIPTHSAVPAWKRDAPLDIKTSIPGILPKGTQSEAERKAITLDYISQTYPEERWTHVYTDGSAEEATRNGGGGIYVRLPDGGTIQKSIPTGTVSTNYKAEAEALQTAATTLEENRDNTHNRVVIFSDALSVLQALLSPRNKDLNTLAASLARLQQSTEHTVNPVGTLTLQHPWQ
nr:hypothetical protein BaRGS_003143 [Batillaria attramentaria]